MVTFKDIATPLKKTLNDVTQVTFFVAFSFPNRIEEVWTGGHTRTVGPKLAINFQLKQSLLKLLQLKKKRNDHVAF